MPNLKKYYDSMKLRSLTSNYNNGNYIFIIFIFWFMVKKILELIVVIRFDFYVHVIKLIYENVCKIGCL